MTRVRTHATGELLRALKPFAQLSQFGEVVDARRAVGRGALDFLECLEQELGELLLPLGHESLLACDLLQLLLEPSTGAFDCDQRLTGFELGLLDNGIGFLPRLIQQLSALTLRTLDELARLQLANGHVDCFGVIGLVAARRDLLIRLRGFGGDPPCLPVR
jgi:hypothetical protein